MNNTTNIMLTTLLVIAHAIELTYELGKASAPYIKATVAFTITCTLYIIEALRYVTTNQESIRDSVGQYFVYVTPEHNTTMVSTPTRLMAPKRLRYARPKNTLRYASA